MLCNDNYVISSVFLKMQSAKQIKKKIQEVRKSISKEENNVVYDNTFLLLVALVV